MTDIIELIDEVTAPSWHYAPWSPIGVERPERPRIPRAETRTGR